MARGIGPLLREARERVQLTQSELARRAGLDPNVVSRLEGGARMKPQFETVAKIAVPLGLSLDALAADLGYRSRQAAPTSDEAVKRVQLASRVIATRKALSSLDGALGHLEEDLQPGRRRPAKERRR